MKIALAYNAFLGAFQDYIPTIELFQPGVKYDLVIFPGGEDINPYNYMQNNTYSMGINKRRDEAEISVFKQCREQNFFMFGVCRGHQLFHVMNGGRLIQDINLEVGAPHPHNHTWETTEFTHPLMPYIPKMVNSLHHQGYVGRSRGEYHLSTYKGIVEVTAGNRWFSVQYHPEFMNSSHEFFRALLEYAASGVNYVGMQISDTGQKQATQETTPSGRTVYTTGDRVRFQYSPDIQSRPATVNNERMSNFDFSVRLPDYFPTDGNNNEEESSGN